MKLSTLNSRLLAALAALLLLGGCSATDELTEDQSPLPIRLSAGIEGITRTTAGGNAWLVDDEIGVFVLAAGGQLANGDCIAGGNNRKFRITNATTGAMELADGGEPICYPQTGQVDIIAYYPYTTVSNADYSFEIDLGTQTTEAAQNAVDVLWVKAAGISKSRTPVGLSFGHLLGKVTFNVTLGAGLGGLSGSDVTQVRVDNSLLNTIYLQDGNVLSNSGVFNTLKAGTPTPGCDATFTAVVAGGLADATFTVAGEEYTCTLDQTIRSAQHYIYPVTIQKSGVSMGSPNINTWETGGSHGTDTATPVTP